MCRRDDRYYKKINIYYGRREEMMLNFRIESLEIFSAIETFKLAKTNLQ